VQIIATAPVGELKMPVLSNAKQERFCQQLALGKTASEAYELAGYKPSRSNASVLKAKQNIADRIAEILQESEKTVLKQIEYTRDVLLSELEEARQLALRLRQASAAVAATMGKAKILGLIIDGREVGDVGAFDHLTDEQLVEEAKKRAELLGIAPRKLDS
jgi:phage terminase small subunit